jgi:NAD(P)-dependent dehydrogenase (short-subunit alcohol dehydrogenase family)
MAEAPTADWAFLRSLLIETTFNVTRAFAAPLKANGRGRFLSVSSPLAQSPAHLHAAYASAKAAADALVLALADELRGSGSTANIIVVSGIITPEMRAADPAAHVGRSALAEEIAAAMLYLCTDEAGAINGARLPLTR